MRSIATRVLGLAVVAVLGLASTACFSSQTVIKLHPDGSGTIEQTNLINTAMLGMAAGMLSGSGERGQAAQPPKLDDIFSEEQLRKQAAQMGTGVSFVSSEKVTSNGMQGAKAIYAFDKVENLSVGGGTHLSDGPPQGPSGPPMQFALAPSGANHRLTVTMPEPKSPATPDTESSASPSTPQVPPEAFAMVKSMFAGARMSLDVEVDGRIVSTNAPASQGSRATLFAVDFGELLSDPSKLQTLQSLKPGTDFATVRKALEGMKGVTIPSDQKITIDFAK